MAEIIHKPLRAPRPGTPAEGVFASMWEAMMAEDWEECHFDGDEPTPMEVVLAQYGRKPRQREATIMATFVTWFGCNIGASLLHRARAEVAAGRWDERWALLFAWTLENRRIGGVNDGIRAVEYLMAPEEDYRRDRGVLDRRPLKKIPELSADDLEVIECLLLWLPCERGQRFIRQCEREVERLRDEERRQRRAAWLREAGGQ